MNMAYLLLGSNIEPEKNIPLAMQKLRGTPDLQVLRVSSTWQTPSVGHKAQDFHNLGVSALTPLDAYALKENVLCEIEHELGRVRYPDKNAPRTIDLDILVFNNQVLDPHIFTYDHLCLPLAEILPDLYSPELQLTLSQKAALILQYTSARKLT